MSPTLIAGGIAAGAFVLVGVQTWRLGNAQEEIGGLSEAVSQQTRETEQAVTVNSTLNENIDELATRISDMVESRRLERVEQDRVLAARDEDLATAVAAARRLEGERDEIFREDLGCNEMGSIRVDAVCPAIAVQLRERTAQSGGGDGDEDGGGAGRGDSPAAGTADTAALLSATLR